MTTQEIAQQLVKLCREAKYEEAYQQLFAPNAVACEPEGLPNNRTEGLDNLLAKTAQFRARTEEIFGMDISDPMVAGDHFVVRMAMDSKMKDQPKMKLEELCMYEVKDGKIVKEQFFFSLPPMG